MGIFSKIRDKIFHHGGEKASTPAPAPAPTVNSPHPAPAAEAAGRPAAPSTAATATPPAAPQQQVDVGAVLGAMADAKGGGGNYQSSIVDLLKLLDLGFEMSQYSVYLKFCAGKEQAEALARKIEAAMPASGKVHLVQITDKQYENIRTYRGRKREPAPKNPSQLALF